MKGMTFWRMALVVAAGVSTVMGSARAADGAAPASTAATAKRSDAEEFRGGGNADAWVAKAEARVRQWPKDGAAYRALAIALMRKQRQCGDERYYGRAEAALRTSLALEPNQYESRKLLAWVLGGQHRFVEAREIAKSCIRAQPGDWWNYGTLADCETELGNYPAALEAAQQMVDRKPNLASYAQAAHQRELHGDPEGALEAYRMALDAGSRRDPEGLAWCRVQMGHVHATAGRAKEAEAEFAAALTLQPGYHLALAGRARALVMLGRRSEAAALYERVLRAVARPDWAFALGDLKTAMGDRAGAKRAYAQAKAIIAGEAAQDHDRMLAMHLADRGGDPKKALALARRAAAVNRDILTCDTLAWALYRNGRTNEAWEWSTKARRLGTKDARLLYHAARIAETLPGRSKEARELMRQALAINPHFDVLDAPKARLAAAR
jgi:tetratricopeptide (TPR) repeat protein